jgi:hypothetical protein
MNAFDKKNKVWELLVNYDYFKEEELHLITSMYGLNMETLNLAINVRFGYQDIIQMLSENDEDLELLKEYDLIDEEENEIVGE